MTGLLDSEDSHIDSRVAGFWVRTAAQMIDSALGFAVGFVSLIIATIVLMIRREPGNPAAWIQSMGGFTFVGTAVSFLGVVLYHSFSEYVGGATFGKLVCGLRVVSEDFRPVSFRGAAIRSAAFVVDALFFGIVAYRSMARSSLYQRVGDHWGATIVIRTRAFPTAARGAGRVSLGLGLGLSAWVAVQVCLFVSKAALPV
jgi:uncharacterized RDD family membrane protein YckC